MKIEMIVFCSLLALSGCATDYSKDILAEIAKRDQIPHQLTNLGVEFGLQKPTNAPPNQDSHATPLSALETTLAGLRQLDQDLERLQGGAQALNETIRLSRGAFKDDAHPGPDTDLTAWPKPPGFECIRESALKYFGAEGRPANAFIQAGETIRIREMCMTNEAFAAPTIGMLLSECLKTTDIKTANQVGKLVGQLAFSHNLQFPLRRTVIGSFFNKELTLVQSVAMLHALSKARDVNALAWVAQSHADDFVGQMAIKMLSGKAKRSAIESFMLRVRTNQVMLATGQGQIWEGLLRLADAQRELVSGASGLIAARETLKALTGSLDEKRQKFIKDIENAEARLAAKQREIDELTKQLAAAIAEARKYKEDYERSGS